jgi:hypothetical protein
MSPRILTFVHSKKWNFSEMALLSESKWLKEETDVKLHPFRKSPF